MSDRLIDAAFENSNRYADMLRRGGIEGARASVYFAELRDGGRIMAVLKAKISGVPEIEIKRDRSVGRRDRRWLGGL